MLWEGGIMARNPKQEEVIRKTDGIYVVDAGPGTGKTHSITKRYLEIIKKEGITVKDVLLLTFTNNAAENMKEKITNKLIEADPSINVLDANVSTFHSFCKQILNQGCENAPSYLGMDSSLSSNFSLSENRILENNFFRKLYNKFRKRNPAYEAEYRIIGGRYFEILSLIRKLLSKGIFPKKEGWFLDGESLLKGNKDRFDELITRINVPEEGSRGPTQSKYLAKFKGKKGGKTYHDLPEDVEQGKILNPESINHAFDEDRSSWNNFIHDLYYAYVEHSIKENRLTFDFLTMFAFLELYHNGDARSRNSFEYVMIDEFQDTSEMQFMLSLLLMKTNNLCVVGDWKQGIYGFRNATIRNIIDFQEKIRYYKELLNKGEERISFPVSSSKLEFDVNFRSSQNILDFSNKALYARGNSGENINAEELDSNVVKLTANFDLNKASEIRFYETNDKEAEFILRKIQELISSDKVIVEHSPEGSRRKITYKDVAVISRTRTFGLHLQELGMKYGIPVNYDGGIELFKTREAILLLAVLRILANREDKKGWTTLLDHYNYSLGDKRKILFDKAYPEGLMEFRNGLFKYKKNVLYLVSKVFNYFRINNNFSNAIIRTVGSVFSNNVISIENLVYFMEDNIESNETYNIDINTSDNAVTVQTIHGSKGLEYPVVFIANCNEKQFPSNKSDKDVLSFDDLLGIRCTKECHSKKGYTAMFDSWKTDVLRSAMFTEYDEERRLLFVAITRAKQFVYFTASRKSAFFKEMLRLTNNESEKMEEITISPSEFSEQSEEKRVSVGDYKRKPLVLSAHDLMKYAPGESGKGMEHGKRVHFIAERLAVGEDVEDSPEKVQIKTFLDGLGAKELRAEVECALPLNDALVRGIIDLLAIFEDRVEIIDYKTDASKLNHEEYKKQLSVYYYAVSDFFKLPVKCRIFYVSQEEVTEIEPLSREELTRLVEGVS